MPARSEAQRKFLNARKGHAWVKAHHFDNRGKLPQRAKRPKKRGKVSDREALLEAFKRRSKRRG